MHMLRSTESISRNDYIKNKWTKRQVQPLRILFSVYNLVDVVVVTGLCYVHACLS